MSVATGNVRKKIPDGEGQGQRSQRPLGRCERNSQALGGGYRLVFSILEISKNFISSHRNACSKLLGYFSNVSKGSEPVNSSQLTCSISLHLMFRLTHFCNQFLLKIVLLFCYKQVPIITKWLYEV
jgi:hypothetical protein